MLEGKLLLGKNFGFKNELLTNILFNPCAIGFDVLGKDSKYNLYARALTPLFVLEMDGRLFKLVYQKNLELQQFVQKQLYSRFIEVENKCDLLLNKSSFERIKIFLIYIFSNNSVTRNRSRVFEISMTHLDISLYVHTSRQSVTTLLNSLRKEGRNHKL
ncbi:MAG: CRP-like cAMP-binding protein [Vicingaceae bacterium]